MEYLIFRAVLAVYAVAAFALAISYLRYRHCTPPEYIFWGVLALLFPILGPFFVIAARPGPKKRVRRALQAKGNFLP